MKIFNLILLALFMPMHAMALSPEPPYIELTKADFLNTGFKYKISDIGGKKYFTLEYPERIEQAYYPHSSHVLTKSSSGTILSRSVSWVGDKYRHIDVEFDIRTADLDVSVIFACQARTSGRCDGARRYGIRSLSRFIKEHALK